MSEKMNVLFIITDQHRADMLHCYGNPNIKTPNIDNFAKDSVRFTNTFCTSPMCMPNRATLLTGYYPNIHGVRSNGINLPANIPTITQSLVNSGYHTINVGKTHFNFWTPAFDWKLRSAESFDDWRSEKPKGKYNVKDKFPIPYYGFKEVDLIIGHGNTCLGHYLDNWLENKDPQMARKVRDYFNIDRYFDLYSDSFVPEDLYNTKFVEENTINFLERYSDGKYENKPFFLHCSFPDPHYPVCPPGKYRNIYKPEDMELPESFNNIENLYKHPFLGKYLREPVFRGAYLRESTEEEVRKFMALSYGSITLLDYSIGQILSKLDKLGLTSNTMVIFTTDHGDFMGDHGLLLKGPAPFEGLLNVPLIWKMPGIKNGVVTESLASSVDIPKTILNILGIKEKKQPPGMQGYDLSPILNDPEKEVRESCLIVEDEEIRNLYTRVCHLVTKDYKLTTYTEIPDYGDIFHRKDDKDGLNNLWYKDKNIRLNLTDQLFHEYLITRSRFPERQGAT
ncbi:MAG: sulfatase [Promethearchaeota archaeon]